MQSSEKVERAKKDVSNCKRIIEKDLQSVANELKETLRANLQGKWVIHCESWSNSQQIIGGCLSFFPADEPSYETIESIISIYPSHDGFQFEAYIAWSNGIIITDLREEMISTKEEIEKKVTQMSFLASQDIKAHMKLLIQNSKLLREAELYWEEWSEGIREFSYL